MKKKMTSRRELLKTTALSGAALAAASLITSCTKSEEKTATKAVDETAAVTAADAPAPAGDLPYVDPTSNKAKALRYAEDASEVPAETRGDKGDTKGAEQFCTNCQFYSEDNGEGGKCALFPGKLVKGKGWCVSWSLKAQS